MNRKDLKQIRTILQSAQDQGLVSLARSNGVSSESLKARASQELSAVSDVYETASLAVDMLRAQLAYASTTDAPSKEIALILRGLRDAMTILADARQEARDTVQDMKSEEISTPLPSSTIDEKRNLGDAGFFSVPKKEM